MKALFHEVVPPYDCSVSRKIDEIASKHDCRVIARRSRLDRLLGLLCLGVWLLLLNNERNVMFFHKLDASLHAFTLTETRKINIIVPE